MATQNQKLRVFQFTKAMKVLGHDISNKDVIEVLNKNGIDIDNIQEIIPHKAYKYFKITANQVDAALEKAVTERKKSRDQQEKKDQEEEATSRPEKFASIGVCIHKPDYGCTLQGQCTLLSNENLNPALNCNHAC